MYRTAHAVRARSVSSAVELRTVWWGPAAGRGSPVLKSRHEAGPARQGHARQGDARVRFAPVDL